MTAKEIINKIILLQTECCNNNFISNSCVAFTVSELNFDLLLKELIEVYDFKIENYKSFKIFDSNIYSSKMVSDYEIITGIKSRI